MCLDQDELRAHEPGERQRRLQAGTREYDQSARHGTKRLAYSTKGRAGVNHSGNEIIQAPRYKPAVYVVQRIAFLVEPLEVGEGTARVLLNSPPCNAQDER